MTVLLGFLGLTLNSAFMYFKKNELQNTADAAALSCVIINNDTACGNGNSFTIASPNVISTNSNSNINNVNIKNFTVSTTIPVTCPNPLTQSNCALASASTNFVPFFNFLFGNTTKLLNASATAGNLNNAPSCLTTTEDFSINGNNTITLTNCSAAIGGTFYPKNQNKSGIVVSGLGGTTIYNTSTVPACDACNPQPIANTAPLPIQPTYNAPSMPVAAAPDCSGATCIYTPGSYAAKVTLTKPTTFSAGTYVFNGGFDNAGYTVVNVTNGATYPAAITGVSFYIGSGKPLALSGSVTLNAPSPANCTAGSGVVITKPLGSVPPYDDLTFSGSGGNVSLTGITSLPSANITLNGTVSNLLITGSLLAHSILLHGNMTPTASTDPCYNLYNNSRVILVK